MNKHSISLHKRYDSKTIEEKLIPGSKLGENGKFGKGRLGNLQIFHPTEPERVYVVSVNGNKYTPLFFL